MLRRQYIVEKKFQWTVIIYTFAISLFTTVVHITISQIVAIDEVQRQTSLSLGFGWPKLLIILAIVFLYVSVFVIGVLFSNRLAGPLFRLRKHMKDVAQGREVAAIKFRKNDYYSDLQQAYNDLIFSGKKNERK